MSFSERRTRLIRLLKGTSVLDAAGLIIVLGVLVRLIFMGMLNLLPEEAYYWNYARHLDIGYLDHPPMVAWLIYLSGAVFGRSEFAVRLPAFLGWFGLAYFMFRLSAETVGRFAGKVVLVLLASLPIYMSVGFLMTPDAPFYACWAGALYFLAKALIRNESRAWYGAGIFLGLGLLSKYTMGLIVPAAVAYMLLNKDARRWFRKPQPYIALLIGFFLFSPVIYWNAEHHWISFAFQGTRRWSGGIDFSLHVLIGSILVLLTPLGFYEALRVFWDAGKHRKERRQTDMMKYRKYIFLVTFAIVPLLVFVIHSLQGQPKLNWTGPAWLSVLPLIAARIRGIKIRHGSFGGGQLARRWLVTAMALVMFYAAGFAYMVDGMPGMKKAGGMKFPIAWKVFGNRLEGIETHFEDSTGSEPIIIGLDKYWLASQANFYDPDSPNDKEIEPEVGGEDLVGGNGLMWNLWVTPESIVGRDALLIGFAASHLDQSAIANHFETLGKVNRERLDNNRGEIGQFYWRIGYKYRPSESREKRSLALKK